jgi:hypothetical protein
MCAAQFLNHFERAQPVGCCIAKDAATRKALRHPVLMGNGDRIDDATITCQIGSTPDISFVFRSQNREISE